MKIKLLALAPLFLYGASACAQSSLTLSHWDLSMLPLTRLPHRVARSRGDRSGA